MAETDSERRLHYTMAQHLRDVLVDCGTFETLPDESLLQVVRRLHEDGIVTRAAPTEGTNVPK